MERLQQYLLSVVAAALICGAMKPLLNRKRTSTTVVIMMMGVFLTVTVIRPLTTLSFSNITDYLDESALVSDYFVEAGMNTGDQQLRAIITEQTEAYVLDKAAALGLEIEVSIRLSEDDPPVPNRIYLTGQVSPYAKARITEYISTDLGIVEVNQIWNIKDP